MHTWWLHISREKSCAICHNKRESCSLVPCASFLDFCIYLLLCITSVYDSDLYISYIVIFPQRLFCRKLFLSPFPAVTEETGHQTRFQQPNVVSFLFQFPSFFFPRPFSLYLCFFYYYFFFNWHDSAEAKPGLKIWLKNGLVGGSLKAHFWIFQTTVKFFKRVICAAHSSQRTVEIEDGWGIVPGFFPGGTLLHLAAFLRAE